MKNRDKVRAIVCNQLKVKPEEVTDGAVFFDNLGADSFDLVELIMTIEEEFEMVIPDEHYQTIKTVDDIIILIDKKRNEASK
ncbi:MAG: acyl carrier protein [Omnitrophica WOR_2 bacterium GWF2_38_59]|nr:MAG: acyl carrier protein [Omnitrophica WOR_2 bacterium GWF2_38_59]OGX57650.1 MAG: acyl carrier protein [Omnitrophica WOR_2 bacterium RIFOXYB2_FULL_38_16]